MAACEKKPSVQDPAPTTTNDTASQVIGIAGGKAIRLTDVEDAIGLELYDLEMQRYKLMRGAVEARLLKRLDAVGNIARVAEIRLEPPLPPRVAIPVDPGRVRPGGKYPIEIVAFCNFESAHCVRLQQQLSRILPLFEGVVQYSERDLILPFHRYAALAALAARCASDQGKYWQFRDIMFAGEGLPDRKRLLGAGRAAGLAMGEFQACLDSRSNRARLDSDFELAQSLGVSSVPAVFVNGLYGGENPEPGQLIWLIEFELNRLGVRSPRLTDPAGPSREPLQLHALIHSKEPGQGLAMLAPRTSPESARFYREGDALGADLTLRRIGNERVEFLNGGVTEWTSFDLPPEPSKDIPAAELDSDSTEKAVLDYPHQGIPVTLDRTEVLVRMADVVALEASLETVPMTAGGYHLLRIADIKPGSLYELLGLEQGDVIVLVNEQPMHEGLNPLWHALQSEDEVRLRVMRQGGLAHHYTFRFE